MKVISASDKKGIKELLKAKKIRIRKINYTRFTFIHYDVMGSGRFFYVDSIIEMNKSLF